MINNFGSVDSDQIRSQQCAMLVMLYFELKVNKLVRPVSIDSSTAAAPNVKFKKFATNFNNNSVVVKICG